MGYQVHGDTNTSFFHTSTIKRRRNTITSLRDRVGNWITDELLPQHIHNYFLSCYTSEASCSNFFPNLPIHQHALSHIDHHKLISPITITVIISSIKSFKPYKASGLDSFHQFFFFFQKKFNKHTPCHSYTILWDSYQRNCTINHKLNIYLPH